MVQTLNPNPNIAPIEVPAAQAAIDELAAQAQTPEDHAQLAEWKAEFDTERAEALKGVGEQTGNLVLSAGGVVASEKEVREAAVPSNADHTYGTRGRRA